jgi:hypothetical protein
MYLSNSMITPNQNKLNAEISKFIVSSFIIIKSYYTGTFMPDKSVLAYKYN